MDRVDIFAPITKREKDPTTGHLYVTGQMTGPGLDGDQQRMDADWLKTAVPDWFRVGNIREMHQAKAVGKAVELSEQSDGSWDIRVKVVDRDAIEKVENQVLTGFSIGVKQPQIIKRSDAPNGAITGGRIIETSLVDAPCLQSCTFTVAKADSADVLQPVEQPELHDGEPDVEKRDVPQAERDRAANNGQAMSDGSFPIKNESDLRNAIRAVGRAKNPAAAKAHIKQRAKALGLSDLIPDSWGSSSSSSSSSSSAKADSPTAQEGTDMTEEQTRELFKTMLAEAGPDLVKAMQAELTKTAAPEVAKVETPDTGKAETPDIVKALADLPDAIQNAVTKAVEPLQTGLAEVTQKVNDLPAPGGPVVTRTTEQVQHSDAAEKQAEYLRKSQDSTLRQDLREGYAALAARPLG